MGDNPVQVTITISPRLAREVERVGMILKKDRASVLVQAFSLYSIFVDQLVRAEAANQEVVLVRRTRELNRTIETIKPRI